MVPEDWQSAAEIEWEDFYRAVEGRELRPLFVDAIPYLPTVTATELRSSRSTSAAATCHPRDFDAVWEKIASALRPDGLFVGHFFGPNDTWADKPDMTFHSRAGVETLLTGFDIEELREQDEDGASVGGPKHWHVFHVIARKPA